MTTPTPSCGADRWCEHCRAHYPTDHYDEEGMHRHGAEWGFFGYALACVDVVERLAAGDWRAARGVDKLVKDGRDVCGATRA